MRSQRLNTYGAAAGWLIGVGGVGLIVLWLLNADGSVNDAWYSELKTAAVVALIVGTMFRAIADATSCVLDRLQPPPRPQRLPSADTGDLRKAVAAAYVEEARVRYRRTGRPARR